MLKGISYFIMFLGSLMVAMVVIGIIFLKFPTGVAEAAEHYSARHNAEAIAGIISSFSSFDGDIKIKYLLPQGECELQIGQNHVNLIVSRQEIEVEGKKITMAEQKVAVPFLQVEGMTVEEYSVKCSPEIKVQLEIQKKGDEITFGGAG